VSGKRSPYPWLLTGNCVYRRTALEDAGLFDEQLISSEDVDLAWRVVLAGWLVDYDDSTEVVHYDGSSWGGFLRKGWTYGRGAAQLSAAYRPHGAEGKFAPRRLLRVNQAETISNLCYWAGYTVQRTRPRRVSVRPVLDVPRFRDAFDWDGATTIRVSPRAVYWFRQHSSVVVQIDHRQRTVLDNVGDFIWRRLVAEENRATVVAAIVERYRVAEATARADVDDLVEELIAVGLLESVTNPER
jgi:hypothetical protein